MGEFTDSADGTESPSVTLESPPDLGFDDISGLDSVRERLGEAVVTPAANERLGAFGASGVLIHGPPGVGKTHVAEALLGELGFDCVEVTPGDLSLERPDKAAERVHQLYEWALDHEPCVLLIDSLDVVAPAVAEDSDGSEQLITELGNVLDYIDDGGQILFLGTATELSTVDERVRRAGRIDLTVALERPDFRRRRGIIADELADIEATGLAVAEMDVDRLAGWTDGFSAAELAEVVERAARKAGTDELGEDTFAAAVDELHDVEEFLSAE
jgi:SpoVK/Ycf46/Vps4 family AAA+-type ATPase